MAKTTNAVTPRRLKMETVITAAINTALSLGIGSPPLTVDISSIHVGIEQGQVSQREMDILYVTGDLTPIITADGVISEERYNITVLYTKGVDTVINSAKDFYSDLLLPLHQLANGTAHSLQHIWSPAGGNVGDEEFITSSTETYLTELPKPVGGSSSEKIKITYGIITPPVTVAVVS